MNGWLMWGLILPLLLVVAGIITIRRRNHRVLTWTWPRPSTRLDGDDVVRAAARGPPQSGA
jgi:hypothetical protein